MQPEEERSTSKPLEPAEPIAVATQTQKACKDCAEPRGAGLRALSAEDKARIGNLIKVLAQERKDKEELQQLVGQQASKMQDMEQERDRSRKKEVELAGRVARSLNLLKTCQSRAAATGQGPQRSEEATVNLAFPREPVAVPSYASHAGSLPAMPTDPAIQPEVSSSRCNALQDVEPRHIEDAELTRAKPLKATVFSLKPPQLSLLQRYLSIQESSAAVPQAASGPLPKRQWTPERLRSSPTGPMADAAVQTPSDAPTQQRIGCLSSSPRRLQSPSMDLDSSPIKASPQPSPRPSPPSPRPSPRPSLRPWSGSPNRLRLGTPVPRRWRHRARSKGLEASNCNGDETHVSPSPSRVEDSLRPSPKIRADLRCRTHEPEPLLGSPLPPRQPADPKSSRQDGNIGLPGLSWAPLPQDSYYAPNMFDVIDSLESSPSSWGAQKARSQPVAIAQELRRLQRELVVIEQRVQRGSKEESPVKSVRQTEASPLWLKAVDAGERRDELELSREVDDVLFLLRERISEKTPEGLLR